MPTIVQTLPKFFGLPTSQSVSCVGSQCDWANTVAQPIALPITLTCFGCCNGRNIRAVHPYYRLSGMSRLSRVCSSLKFAQYFRFTAGGIFKLNTLSDYVFCHNSVAVSGLSAVRTFTNCSPSGDQGVFNRIVKEQLKVSRFDVANST